MMSIWGALAGSDNRLTLAWMAEKLEEQTRPAEATVSDEALYAYAYRTCAHFGHRMMWTAEIDGPNQSGHCTRCWASCMVHGPRGGPLSIHWGTSLLQCTRFRPDGDWLKVLHENERKYKASTLHLRKMYPYLPPPISCMPAPPLPVFDEDRVAPPPRVHRGIWAWLTGKDKED